MMRYQGLPHIKPQVGFFIIFALGLFGLLLQAPAASAVAKTAGYLNANIPPSGSPASTINTVVGLENQCTSELNTARSGGGSARNIVNAAAYVQTTWLSQRSDPTNSLSTTISPGTSAINMQINEYDFLCAIVTQPASGSTFPIATSQVTAGRYPNERPPVPDTVGSINAASRYETNDRIDSITVPPGSGSIVFVPKTLGYKRDNASRYWFAAPVDFIYKTPTPLAPSTSYTVTVSVKFRDIATYHDYGPTPDVANCSTPGKRSCSRCSLPDGTGIDVAYNNFNACGQQTVTRTFTFKTSGPPPSCSPGSPDVGTFIQPGDSASLRLSVSKAQPTPQDVTYSITNSITGVVTTGIAHLPANSTTTSPAVSLPPFSSAGTYSITWTVPNLSGECKGTINVVDLPYFNVYGSGVRSGGDFPSSCSGNGVLASWFDNNSGHMYGSSTGLNAIAMVNIVGFASNQTARGSPTRLTFANTAGVSGVGISPNLGGSFDTGGSYCFDDPAEPTGATDPGASMSVVGQTGVRHRGTASAPSSLRITGGVIKKAQNLSVFVNGDVYISGDGISYDDSTWTSAADIPSFVLVATGNIYIDAGVTQLDGVYIAKHTASGTGGQIYTCADDLGVLYKSGDMYNQCNQQLTIHGVFEADRVNLMRTFGTLKDGASAAPSSCTDGGAPNDRKTCSAEVFDFSPELYLSKPNIKSTSSSAVRYDAIVSLPPIL